MERANSEDGDGNGNGNGNGGNKLPIGFRFYPTDEELMVHYLKRKVFSLPLPATVIPDLDVFHSNPWDLPGDLKEKRYFFCQRKRNTMSKCSSSSLSAECGYWKARGKDKQIIAPGSNLLIGIKKCFVFYKTKKSGAVKTPWFMHEFCLVGSINTPYLTQKLMIQVGDWVVCRVYQRKRKTKNQGTNAQLANINKCRTLQGIKGSDHMNLRMEGNNELGFSFVAQTSLSSCSSGITDISCNDLDQEANSHNVSF
ncbi:hypothetical protein BUALT_Bualt04G0177300 [Buddleja alternifolia]|uniref:NAC domain-containing protein n=1 Tax=Buddleja alternifolia TaxID=168488 RepID=A0AAV6XWM8_9LAMI|nr:hypothetical protein BUALT_Bualt04G0177300 [Buddleja alternifolia]